MILRVHNFRIHPRIDPTFSADACDVVEVAEHKVIAVEVDDGVEQVVGAPEQDGGVLPEPAVRLVQSLPAAAVERVGPLLHLFRMHQVPRIVDRRHQCRLFNQYTLMRLHTTHHTQRRRSERIFGSAY